MSNYKGPQYNFIVAASTIAVADIVLDGGILSFGVPAATALRPICDYQDLLPGKCTVTVAVAGTAQVDTLTFTAANSTTYTVKITQYDPVAKRNIYRVYSYTTAASGDTATTIGDSFRTQINADSGIYIAATGTTTLILTAETRTVVIDNVSNTIAYYTFTTDTVEPVSTALVLTTPGVVPIGTTGALALQGVVVAAGLSYTTVTLNYNAKGIATNAVANATPNKLNIYIDQASGNYATVLAKWNFILAARAVSIGGVADPEAIAVA